MTEDWITIELLSGTTVAGGQPMDGEVDTEVEHDDFGLPYLGGKALHGLLRDTWLSMADQFPALASAAWRVLGRPRRLLDEALLAIGDATVDDATTVAIKHAEQRLPRDHPLRPGDVLRALTDIRVQTAEDRASGAPLAGSLRRSRVVLPGLSWSAPLRWTADAPQRDDLRCLALCLLGTRHVGLARWRGRGHVRMTYRGDLHLTSELVKEAAS